MDEIDNRLMSLQWRSESWELSRDFVSFILEKSNSQQNMLLNMTSMRWACPLNFGKLLEGRTRSCMMGSGEEVRSFAPTSSSHCNSTNSACSRAGGSSTGKSMGSVNSINSATSGLTPQGKFLPHRSNDTKSCGYLARSTSSKARKICRRLRALMCACMCHEIAFALQLHNQAIDAQWCPWVGPGEQGIAGQWR